MEKFEIVLKAVEVLFVAASFIISIISVINQNNSSIQIDGLLDLQRQVPFLNNTIMSLMEDSNNKTQGEISNLKAEITKLFDETINLKTEDLYLSKAIEDSNKNLKEEISILRVENSKLSNRIEVIEKSNQNLNEEISSLKTENVKLSERVLDLEKTIGLGEIIILLKKYDKQDIQALLDLEANLKDALEKINNLQISLLSFQNEVIMVKMDLPNIKASSTKNTDDVLNVQTKISNLQTSMQTDVTNLKGSSNKNTDDILNVQTKISNLQTSMQTNVTNLKASSTKNTDDILNVQTKISNLQASSTNNTAEIFALQTKLTNSIESIRFKSINLQKNDTGWVGIKAPKRDIPGILAYSSTIQLERRSLITCHFTGHSNTFKGIIYLMFYYQVNCKGDYISFGDSLTDNSMMAAASNWQLSDIWGNLSFTQFTELDSGQYCFYLRGHTLLIDGGANLSAPTARCTLWS